MATAAQPLSLESLGSLPRIPGFAAGLGLATTVYEYSKATTAVLPYGIPELIETAEARVIATATPFIAQHRTQIEDADAYALAKIESVSQIVTSTKTTLANKLDETKSTIQRKVIAPAASITVASITAAAEQAAVSPLRRAAVIASNVVDVLLPEEDAEVPSDEDWITTMGKIYSEIRQEGPGRVEPTPTPVTPFPPAAAADDEAEAEAAGEDAAAIAPGKELLATIAQYQQLATKTNSRAAKAAMLRLNDVKRRADVTVTTMRAHTVDLIAYAKSNIDSTAATTCERVGIAPPPAIDDLAGMATEKLGAMTQYSKAAAADKVAALRFEVEARKEAAAVAAAGYVKLIEAKYDVARGLAEAKSTEAYATARSATAATAEYIQAQRKLLQTVLADAAGQAAVQIAPVQEFVKAQLDESETFDIFVAKMQRLKEQAKEVQAKLAANETVAVLSSKALDLYTKFEGVADPYMFNALTAIRAYVLAADAAVTATAGVDADAAADTTDADADGTKEPDAEENDLDAFGAEAETEMPEADEDADEGLVLKVKPTRRISQSGPYDDIDDEAALLSFGGK